MNHVITGMFYSDESVLLLDSPDSLQELIKIYEGEGDSLELKISSDKSEIMVFIYDKEDPLNIQDILIDQVENLYEYG